MSIFDSLSLPLAGVCEAAARSCAPWIGSGKKDEGDGLAVDAMRSAINQLPINGMVVIGEGAKDEAPALYDGEKVGSGSGPGIDIAVDPIEGTNLFANGLPGSICTLAAAPAGSMFRPGACFYMDKQVYPAAARGRIDPAAPLAERLSVLADSLNKPVSDIIVFALNKPRHDALVSEIRALGAKVRLVSDGDVNGAIMAVLNDGADALMGIGGTPEGIVSACAARALGAEMFGRMAPQMPTEIAACALDGVDTQKIYTRDELVGSDDVLFLATGLTRGDYVSEVIRQSGKITTDTLMISHGVVRRLQTTISV